MTKPSHRYQLSVEIEPAVAESFFACMKREELSHKYYNSLEELEAAVAEYIIFFNESRPHYKLGNKTHSSMRTRIFFTGIKKQHSGVCLKNSVQNTVCVSNGGADVSDQKF